MTEMEVMLDQLRAEPLENTGLVEALKKVCESIRFRTGAQVEFKLGVIPPTEQMAPGAAEATLRAAQEALSNVARHARASRVVVSLDSAAHRMELTVKDDGAGFDLNQGSRGMGIANMRRRAEEFGGKFEIASSSKGGATVKFSIPYAGGSRSEYRNRGIALVLGILGVLLNDVADHWSIAPAVTFVTVIGVIHYLRAYRRPRRLSEAAS
jgi:two-component system sensor histidine kinase DegS